MESDQNILSGRRCYCETKFICKKFCGKCIYKINDKICDKDGHICHHPQGVPFTGSWCDEHFILLYKEGH